MLPAYEYTAKDVATSIASLCLAYEASRSISLRFVHLLFQHVIRHGVDVKQTTIQTDNGSEFIGHVEAKRTSAFARLVEQLLRRSPHHRPCPCASLHRRRGRTSMAASVAHLPGPGVEYIPQHIAR